MEQINLSGGNVLWKEKYNNDFYENVTTKLKINTIYGSIDYPININQIQASAGAIICFATGDGFSGADPRAYLGGNRFLLLSLSSFDAGKAYPNLLFGFQLCCGFGSKAIITRNCTYDNAHTGSWSSWQYLTQ